MSVSDIVELVFKYTDSDNSKTILQIVSEVEEASGHYFTFDEFYDNIVRLYNRNYIVQINRGTFHRNTSGDKNLTDIEMVTNDEYNIIIEELKEMDEKDKSSYDIDERKGKYDFSKVTVCWATDLSKFEDNDEKEIVYSIANEFEDQFSKYDDFVEVGGVEYSYNKEMDSVNILIWGNETDEDTDKSFKIISKISDKYQFPKGSYFIKHYKDHDVEFEIK